MNELTNYELNVISSCRKLLADTNEIDSVHFDGDVKEDMIHVVKNEGRWYTYFAEKGRVSDYKEFNDVYDLLLDLLGSNFFPRDYICYYMSNFPSKLYFEEERGKTR